MDAREFVEKTRKMLEDGVSGWDAEHDALLDALDHIDYLTDDAKRGPFGL